MPGTPRHSPQIKEAARAIQGRRRRGGEVGSVTLRFGSVSAVTAPTVTVTLPGGATVANVPHLAAYSPTAGDSVALIQSGASLLVIGKIA
jgi:hypothetical protein